MATSAPCGWVTNLWWCFMDSKLWRMVSPSTQRMFLGDYRPICSTNFHVEEVRCLCLWKNFVSVKVLSSQFTHLVCSRWLIQGKPVVSLKMVSKIACKVLLSHVFENLTRAAAFVLARSLIYPLARSLIYPSSVVQACALIWNSPCEAHLELEASSVSWGWSNPLCSWLFVYSKGHCEQFLACMLFTVTWLLT